MIEATRGVDTRLDLVALARRGDDVAMQQLVGRYRTGLHAHCYRMLGSMHDADDALQESLLAAWRGLAAFEGRSSLRVWLYRIATNVCLRSIARRPRRGCRSTTGRHSVTSTTWASR